MAAGVGPSKVRANAIRSPSGDHVADPSDAPNAHSISPGSARVRRVRPSPEVSMTKIPAPDAKAMYRPFGDQAGSVSLPGLLVRLTRLVPAESMT